MNRPLSLNRWGYVEGNPVINTDPSGYAPCNQAIAKRVEAAEKYGIFSNTDYMNTYTAAGLGVQCAGWDKPWLDEYQGVGIGQITDKKTETECGEIIVVNGNPRGGVVRCYITISNIDA